MRERQRERRREKEGEIGRRDMTNKPFLKKRMRK